MAYILSLPPSLSFIVVNTNTFHSTTWARNLIIILNFLLPHLLTLLSDLLILFLKHLLNPSLFLHPQWPYFLRLFSNLVLIHLCFQSHLILKIIPECCFQGALSNMQIQHISLALNRIFWSKSSIDILDGSDLVQRDWPTYKIINIFGPFAKCLEYFPIFMITTSTLLTHFHGPSRGYGYTLGWEPIIVSKITPPKLLQNNFQSL